MGYLRKKDPHNVGGWKRRWFTLKGKSLVYYRRVRETWEGTGVVVSILEFFHSYLHLAVIVSVL